MRKIGKLILYVRINTLSPNIYSNDVCRNNINLYSQEVPFLMNVLNKKTMHKDNYDKIIIIFV